MLWDLGASLLFSVCLVDAVPLKTPGPTVVQALIYNEQRATVPKSTNLILLEWTSAAPHLISHNITLCWTCAPAVLTPSTPPGRACLGEGRGGNGLTSE